MAQDECDHTCTGNANEICGSSWRLSVYGPNPIIDLSTPKTITTTTTPTTTTISGCLDCVTVYSCRYSSEHHIYAQAGEQNALLQCDDGLVIRVNSATYGKPTKDQCLVIDPNHLYQNDLTCGSTADLTAHAKTKCDGQQSCTYHGTQLVAGDPCVNVAKHTAIEYSCVNN